MSAPFRRPALAFGVALVLLAAVLAALWLRTPTLPDRVADDYAEFKRGELHLEMLTTDGSVLEQFFAHRGIDFETRVADLGHMRFNLQGGRVHRIAERPAAVFAYTGPAGEYVLSAWYPGTSADLPRGATLREHDSLGLRVYRKGDLTICFWQDGSLSGVLSSADLDSESLIQLAFAMATKDLPDVEPEERGDEHE